MAQMDFPADPVLNQKYTNSVGVVYQWDGTAWITGFYDSESQALVTLGDIIDQIRILLQDTDVSSGEYRYSTASIVLNINQCMADLYRIRPDLFLERNFIIPTFNSANPDTPIGIEQQYMPPVIYYVVGLTQVRDDEQNQDSRALGFLKVFQNAVVSGGIAA